MTPNPIATFTEETDAVAAFLADRPAELWERETRFKRWTVGDIMAHLHVFNLAAHWSLTEPERFRAFMADALPRIAQDGHQTFHRTWMTDHTDARTGADVFALWRDALPAMIADFAAADLDARVEWAGPPMSAGSSLIARQMEHWAHLQAVHDLLEEPRIETDRLHTIAELGVRTYSFSHRIRGLEPPRPKPHVRLVAPSGAIWEWNDLQDDNRANNSVRGPATAFCQTVTQCRNVADTALVCTGKTAKRWMANAQCFAGAAETPPMKGIRL